MAIFLVAARVQAAASARLVYVRGLGAEECPGENALRAAVEARLGYDPFFAWAHDTLVPELSRAGGEFRVDLKLVDEHNALRAKRGLGPATVPARQGRRCASESEPSSVASSSQPAAAIRWTSARTTAES
jgi:hypothetical protein